MTGIVSRLGPSHDFDPQVHRQEISLPLVRVEYTMWSLIVGLPLVTHL